MKHLKIFLFVVISAIAILSFNSCKKCKGEDPRSRIINNGTDKASVQIKTSGGNTVNINNVDPGSSSAYSSSAPGLTVFTITIKTVNYEITVNMEKCFEYDIKIDANNNLTSTPIDRNK